MIKLIVCILTTVILSGCSAPMQQTFPEIARSHLWTAMVATAMAPQYESDNFRKRWIVAENEVELHPKQGQIDVKRIIHRSLQLPRQRPQRDRRDILFSVYLLPTTPPTIEFVSHNSKFLPIRSLNEAQRYFDAVEVLLVPIK